VREARNRSPEKSTRIEAAVQPAEKTRAVASGLELARQAIEDGKAANATQRSSLGASFLARAGDGLARAGEEGTPPQIAAESTPDAKVWKGAMPPAALGATARADGKVERAEKGAAVQTASAAAALAKPQPPAAQAPKCRVWTASYGGQKAILIRVQSEGAVNYTVLDVNDGAEKREADAYIAAYARGGSIAGEFASPNQALDRAFELCPES